MNTKLFLIPLIIVTAVACSPDSGSKGGNSEPVLPSANFKPEKAPALTEEQKTYLKERTTKGELVGIISDLIEKTTDSDKSKAERLEKLEKASDDQKVVLKDVKSHCMISNEIPRTTGSAGTKAGDKMIIDSESAIKGPNCPVEFQEIKHREQTTISSNIDELKAEYERTKDISVFQKFSSSSVVTEESSRSMKVVDKSLAELSDTVSNTLKLKSVMAMSVASAKVTSLSIAVAGSGELKMASGDVAKLSFEVQQYVKENVEDSVFSTKMEFPSFVVIFQMVKTQGSDEPKLYLNGEEVSAEALAGIGISPSK